MKRLLLAPLLFFLTSCSNDLSIKSNIGEKLLIKRSTISFDKKSYADLIKIVEANIEKDISKENEDSEYYRKQLITEQGYLQARLSRPMTSISRKIVTLTKESIDINTRKIKESDNRIFNIKEKGKSLINDIEEKSSNYKLPDVHVLDISYQPIAVDLNNKKTVLRYEYVSCFNPKLNNEIKDFWIKNDNSLREPYLLSSIKICEKYAKF